MARNFDKASNHRIEIAGLSDYTTSISVSAWLNVNSIVGGGEFYTIFSKAKDGNDRNIGIDYRIRTGSEHFEVYWTQPTSTFIEYFFEKNLVVGAWNHLAVTIDWTTNPDSVHMYFNGVDEILSGGSSNATPTTGSPALNRIGSLIDAAGSAFDGKIAEFAIWPGVVLDAGEVLALSKRYAPFVVHPAGLELYAPLIRDLFDYKGLTLTNQGTTTADHAPVIYAG